jgi:hypothetical protein
MLSPLQTGSLAGPALEPRLTQAHAMGKSGGFSAGPPPGPPPGGRGLGLGLGYCSSPFTVENQDLRHDRPSGRGAGGGSSPNNCSRMDPPLASHCCLRAFRTLLICLTAFFRLVIDTSMSFHHAGCPLPGGAGHGGSSLVIRLRKKFPKKTGQWITMLLNAIQGKAFKWIT